MKKREKKEVPEGGGEADSNRAESEGRRRIHGNAERKGCC